MTAGSGDPNSFAVLLVDLDDRALRLAASHIEHRIPAAVVLKAVSDVEARSLSSTQEVDFIVFDCEGASSERSALLTQLSRACPNAKLALTGRSRASFPDIPNILGFLSKPYRVDDLIGLIVSARGAGPGSRERIDI